MSPKTNMNITYMLVMQLCMSFTFFILAITMVFFNTYGIVISALVIGWLFDHYFYEIPLAAVHYLFKVQDYRPAEKIRWCMLLTWAVGYIAYTLRVN